MKRRFLATCVAVILAGMATAAFSCALSPEETRVVRLEEYLRQLESDWNSGVDRKPPMETAGDLRSLRQGAMGLDRSGLDRDLEKRLDRALGELDLFLMIILDEAAQSPSGTARTSS